MLTLQTKISNEDECRDLHGSKAILDILYFTRKNGVS